LTEEQWCERWNEQLYFDAIYSSDDEGGDDKGEEEDEHYAVEDEDDDEGDYAAFDGSNYL
jgi:hypothetical protein